MGKGTEVKTEFDLIEDFVDELIEGGIQDKKPEAITDIRNERKGNNGSV